MHQQDQTIKIGRFAQNKKENKALKKTRYLWLRNPRKPDS